MPSTGQIILPQYNSGGNWDEKLITPENGKVLGFDASLNPVQLSKQDTLVSGTNIKTINGNSLLGSGNIVAGSPWTTIIVNEQTLSNVKSDMTSLSFVLQNTQRLVLRLFAGLITNSTAASYSVLVNFTQTSTYHATSTGRSVVDTGGIVVSNREVAGGTVTASEKIISNLAPNVSGGRGAYELNLVVVSSGNNNTVKLVANGTGGILIFKPIVAEYMIW